MYTFRQCALKCIFSKVLINLAAEFQEFYFDLEFGRFRLIETVLSYKSLYITNLECKLIITVALHIQVLSR